MEEKHIMEWMKDRVRQEGLTDAATLAREFLLTHNIKKHTDPNYQRILDASFKITQCVYEFEWTES